MKKLILITLLLICTPNFSLAEPPVCDYSKFKYWEYDLNFKVVILFPEEFRLVVDYYFISEDKKQKKTIEAFTAFHNINGKIVPIMFTQAKVNLSPLNDELGHELKHIINHIHTKKAGHNRFPLPCSYWK